MKNKTSFHHLALLSSLILPSSLQALEVHEWGTFTILSSAQGGAVDWYQPFSDISQLPPFTYNPMMMKQGIRNARVRMETPVIYFYPEEPMTVHARVTFRNGTITERFPAPASTPYSSGGLPIFTLGNHAGLVACTVTLPTSDQIFNQRVEEFTSTNRPLVTYWTGDLLPPNHEDAKLIPAVSGKAGAHYAAARAVPDAWLFRSNSKDPFALINPNNPQVEKFIFYRGAGQEVPPYYASMSNENSITFRNHSQSGSTFQIAMRVRDGRATWTKMPNIAGPDGTSNRDSSVTFSEETIPVEQADKELSAVFLTELISRGLTKAEAQAMIDTWNHTWFTEPGQRVFTIVDRTWVDSVLPLAISPEPKKIERVFVARYEIISPETEQKLAKLLQEESSEQSAREYASLQLGRFAHGAAEIVGNRKKEEVTGKYRQLESIDAAAKAKAKTPQ